VLGSANGQGAARFAPGQRRRAGEGPLQGGGGRPLRSFGFRKGRLRAIDGRLRAIDGRQSCPQGP
jgi:hypothetical protein